MRATGNRLGAHLPLVAPLKGLGDGAWGKTFIELSANVNLDFMCWQPYRPLLPAPNQIGNFWWTATSTRVRLPLMAGCRMPYGSLELLCFVSTGQFSSMISIWSLLKHADMAQQLFFKLVGWEVSAEKEANFDAIARILGVQINLNESMMGIFTICNVETRIKDLVNSINLILEKKTLSAAEMRVLRGRLNFAEAQIYGHLTGIHMQQLSRWEHIVGDAPI